MTRIRLCGVQRSALVLLLAGAIHVPSALAAPEDDKAYRAGIGFANKGMNDLAATELKKYLEAQPEGTLVPNARYTLAVCLVRLGKHGEAASELDRVIAIAGFEFAADARFLRAQCASATGDDAAAIQMLKKLLRENPGFAQADRATELYGEALYRTGKYPQARAQLEDFSSKWPKSAVVDRADLFCALAAAGAGDDAKAAERADALVKRSPNGPYAANAALLGAQCRQRAGDLDGAASLYEVAAKATDEQVKRDALLGSAQVARARGKTGEADGFLRQLKAGSLAGAPFTAATVEEGRLLYDQGKPEEALKVFAGLAGDSGAQDTAAYWVAKCEMKLGRNDRAAEHFGDAAAANPKSPLLADMLFDRASALSRAGKNEEAARAFGEWRGRFATHELFPEALAAEAACLYRVEKYAASLELCAEFVRRFPKHERATSVELLIAEDQFLAGEYAPAEGAYRAWIERHGADPGAWRARVRRGLCLIKIDRVDEAVSVLSAALGDGKGEADPGLRREAMLALGENCFARGDWPGAEKWFGAAAPEMKDASGEADALLRLGISLERQKKYQEALPILERAVGATGATGQSAIGTHARFERAQVLVELGRQDDARAEFEAVIASEAKGESKQLTGHALRQLASIASKQGKPEEAAELLGRSSEAGDGGTLLQQGNAWLAAGKYDKAEDAFTRFVKANARDPKAVEARVQRAIAINRQDRHEDAIAELTKLGRRIDAMDPALAASARYELALALRAVGRDADAAEAYRGMLAGSPPPTLGAFGALDLAQILVKEGKFDEAVVTLGRCRESAASLKPEESSRVLEREMYVRGLCLLKLGKPGEAAAAVASFRERYPTSELAGSVSLVLGDALVQSGKAAAGAEELARVAQDKAPADVASVALLKLGDACAATGQWTRSEEAYTAFLDRFPKSELWFQARFGQGFARENQGRQDAAIEAYRDVVARHEGPTAARAQFQIGECLYAQKKYEQAVGELLKVDVLYSSPEWTAAALYEAGRCLDEAGRAADATKQFEELVQRFPESRWAVLAKERPKVISSAGLPGRGADAKTR